MRAARRRHSGKGRAVPERPPVDPPSLADQSGGIVMNTAMARRLALGDRVVLIPAAGGLSTLCGCESNGRSQIDIDNHDVGAVGATRRHHSHLLVQRTVARTRGDTLGNAAAS